METRVFLIVLYLSLVFSVELAVAQNCSTKRVRRIEVALSKVERQVARLESRRDTLLSRCEEGSKRCERIEKIASRRLARLTRREARGEELLSWCDSEGPAPTPTPSGDPIGINLNGANSWQALIFKDAFKQARSWIPRRADDVGWDSGETIPLRSDGYPVQIPHVPSSGIPQKVTTILVDGPSGVHPTGTYILTFEGSGQIDLYGEGTEDLSFTTAGRHEVAVSDSGSGTGVYLDIVRSEASDPIRNIHFIAPGFESSYTSAPFNPAYIKKLQGFRVLRTMQTQRINDGEVPCSNSEYTPYEPECEKHWEDRVRVNSFTQGSNRGVAYEYLIELANTAGADLWITIQHAATADYIRSLAELIKRRLERDRKVYIEYSNEVWNWAGPYLPQHTWVRERGLAAGFSDNPTLARHRAFAYVNAEMYSIFEEVFAGEDERVVNVLGAFIADSEGSETALQSFQSSTYNPFGSMPEAIAVGAYFGGDIPQDILDSNEVASITTDQILSRAASDIQGEIRDFIRASAAVAVRHNVDFIAYEGGAHIVEMNGWSNNVTLGNKLIAAQRTPGMYSLYQSLLDTWYAAGGKMFAAYSFVEVPSVEWGSFGALENLGQTEQEAHRYRALQDRIHDR